MNVVTFQNKMSTISGIPPASCRSLSSPAGSHNDHHSEDPSMMAGPDMNFMWDPRLVVSFHPQTHSQPDQTLLIIKQKFTNADFANDPFYSGDRIGPLRLISNLRKGASSLCRRLRKAAATLA